MLANLFFILQITYDIGIFGHFPFVPIARTPPFLKGGVDDFQPKAERGGGFRPKIKKGGLEEERGGSVKKGGVQRFCT